jgi:hypothetical protein
MIGLQIVLGDLAMVTMVQPGAMVMILPLAMMMYPPVMVIMAGVTRGTIVQMMVVEEMPVMVTRMARSAVMPFPVIADTGKEENAGHQDQEDAKISHDVLQVFVIQFFSSTLLF